MKSLKNGDFRKDLFSFFALNEDGSFDPGFDAHGGYNSHFYEATAWDASYFNYNDVPRLVETMGGPGTFTKRLLWACEHSVNYYNDDNGKEGYLNFTNEPSFHIPWLFWTDEINRPDLAAAVIDGIIKRFSRQNDYPGDEDNGGMSSYYVFLMCGFFPSMPPRKITICTAPECLKFCSVWATEGTFVLREKTWAVPISTCNPPRGRVSLLLSAD